MVEIQKPSSALKRPSLKRETVVVNNSAPMKKVTLVPKDERRPDYQERSRRSRLPNWQYQPCDTKDGKPNFCDREDLITARKTQCQQVLFLFLDILTHLNNWITWKTKEEEEDEEEEDILRRVNSILQLDQVLLLRIPNRELYVLLHYLINLHKRCDNRENTLQLIFYYGPQRMSNVKAHMYN
uniref:Uncharacterized protein n=1 Tax=Glossina austeni TaxID=7395 RepID=A0A1A9UUI7_GLOAU